MNYLVRINNTLKIGGIDPMKQKKLDKKIVIRKVTIANLESAQLDAIRGGATDYNDTCRPYRCPPGWYTVPPEPCL